MKRSPRLFLTALSSLVPAALVLAAGMACAQPPGAETVDTGTAEPNAAAQAAGEHESVKPGINERWKTGEVDELVGMLERDGREIFEAQEALADQVVGGRSGLRIADVGAGSGFMVEQFARRVGPEGKVYGVDINGEMMARLAEHAREQGFDNVETVTCSETSVDLPPASVDVIFLADTYHHFEYPSDSLASIHEALDAGGELVIVDFERIDGVSSDWVLDHVRLGKKGVIAEVTHHGFELVDDVDAPYLSENYLLRFRKSG